VLIEALDAYTEGDRRILEDMSVLGAYSDSIEPMQRYKALHREFPQREFYVAHSSMETFDITERVWLGIRS
jgi:hypothetical protein